LKERGFREGSLAELGVNLVGNFWNIFGFRFLCFPRIVLGVFKLPLSRSISHLHIHRLCLHLALCYRSRFGSLSLSTTSSSLFCLFLPPFKHRSTQLSKSQ